MLKLGHKYYEFFLCMRTVDCLVRWFHRLYMPNYLHTKVSEGVCENSRNFDVVLSGVSPPFSGLPSGYNGVLRCSV